MSAATRQLRKKVCLLGDMSVGKTSLVRRFVEGRFDDRYLSTLGVKVSRKVVDLHTDSGVVELSILLWDIAGGVDTVDIALRTSYLRGSSGAVLVCDLTRAETLRNLIQYAHQLRVVAPTAVLVLAANKADLEAEHQVTADDLAQVAGELGATSIITSAKTGAGVEDLFRVLGDAMVATTAER
ncbi:MAG: GTP-binding protein [Caldilineaceae bacterium]|nr:GTP-binding protein [Caldilineaceae bacterium]